jgi:hypothetical protein
MPFLWHQADISTCIEGIYIERKQQNANSDKFGSWVAIAFSSQSLACAA